MNKKLQEQCKDRIDGGWKQYACYTPPQEVFDKARRLNDEEVHNKLEASKKLTAHAYHKAGMDPGKSNKGQ